MKILNLYAGRGGNRKKWGNCKVVAVEYNRGLAEQYQKDFPQDDVYVDDAHDFLLKHFREYDFIWASPPCPTHSRLRMSHPDKIMYPDMTLYQEILLLQHWFKGKWCVENVVPYYAPLIKPTVMLGRHYFWTNFAVPQKQFNDTMSPISRGRYRGTGAGEKDDMIYKAEQYGFDYYAGKGYNKRLAIRNMTDPDIAKYILECAYVGS